MSSQSSTFGTPMGPDPLQDLQAEDLEPWLAEEFSRSGGPGGQNVNKLNTRVSLYFDLETCTRLSEALKIRLRQRLGARLQRDGRVRVVAQAEREQGRNRSLARERLVELLREAAQRPKSRRETRPTYGSKRRRRENKEKRSSLKRDRSRKNWDG